MADLSCKEVKDAMLKYERRHAPRFRNFQFLGKKIEKTV